MTGVAESAPADDAEITVERCSAPHVAVVTFTRGRHNFVSHGFLTALAETMESLPESGFRVAVLRSGGRHFCAGADFVKAGPSGVTGPHIYEAVPRLFRLPIPVIAAIDGAAIGAGLGLAASADFRIASPSAYFLANFTRLGISQGFGLSLTLPRLIGTQRATEMIYSARRISGEEAVHLGLCDRLAPPEQLLEHAIGFASEMALSSPQAVAAARNSFRADLMSQIVATLANERAAQKPLLDSADFREGVAAWNAKRLPQFGGT